MTKSVVTLRNFGKASKTIQAIMFLILYLRTYCKIVTMALGSRDLLIKFGVQKDRFAFIRHDFVSDSMHLLFKAYWIRDAPPV